MKHYMLGFITLILYNLIVDVTSTDTSDSSYFITVNYGRFTEQVLQSNDSWILIFHRGVVNDAWIQLEQSVRGLTWLATVDVKSESKLLNRLGLEPSSVPVARVYPFGGMKQKLAEWQDVQNWREAERFALKSIPADIPVLSTDNIEQFISESHSSSTARFPTVLLTDSREITPTLRAIKHRFSRYFNIGTLVTPTVDELKKLGLDVKTPTELPRLVVIFKQRQKTEGPKTKPQKPKYKAATKADKVAEDKPRFVTKAIPYSAENFGELSYSGIMRFFFSINHQFRYTLPEGSDKDLKTESMMSDIMDIEQERFDELFGRKQISSSQKSRTESSDHKQMKSNSGKPDTDSSGGKCPFGFDKLSKNKPKVVKTNPVKMMKEEL